MYAPNRRRLFMMASLTAFFLLLYFILLGRITAPQSARDMHDQIQVERQPELTANLRDFLGWERDVTPDSGSNAVPAPSSISVRTDIPTYLRFSIDTSALPLPSSAVTASSLTSSLFAQVSETAVTSFVESDRWEDFPVAESSIASDVSPLIQDKAAESQFATVGPVTGGLILGPKSSLKEEASAVPSTVPQNTASETTSTETPRYRGMSIINSSPFRAGQMRNATEWNHAFRHVHNLPNDLNAVRLYSTTDGSARHLREALSMIQGHNLSIHAGVWSGGDDHLDRFALEIKALDEALAEFGCGKIMAVSVGNEDIYSSRRNDTLPSPLKDIMLLVDQTQAVMEVLDKHDCCNVKVTHADTFGDWLNTSFTEPLIRQVDFLTVNIFPYWSGMNIDKAAATFWANMNETITMARSYGKEVWIGETGWPIEGASVGQAVPSSENARKYWNQVGCKLMKTTDAFWYTEWDTTSNGPSFGLLDKDGTSIIGDLSC